KYEIGPAGSDRNERLPLNLQVQGLWPSRFGSGPERGLLQERKNGKKKNLVPTCSAICGTTPVDVKNNSGSNTKHPGVKAKLAGENTEKTGTKP
ncbi:MAG TPA: hypothetical protein VK579_00095, partial [Terriglobales bacterium]|nr:hypothetical protein [Terriglobales bacterium]